MVFFTLFYLLFSLAMVFPPVEFVSVGLTIPSLFSKYLGSEGERFIEFHIGRVICTLIVHSLLPLGYIVLFTLYSDVSPLQEKDVGYVWQISIALAILLPTSVMWMILNWTRDTWEFHPICLKIKKFCNEEHWTHLASSINIEFRQFDKLTLLMSSTSRAYVTNNWIIKVGLYDVHFAHQDDAVLIVNRSDTHDLSPTGDGQLQYINVEVKSATKHIKPFNIRLLAQDFNDLQDKVRRPIVVLPNIVFHKTTKEKFVEVFKEQVALNEKYMYNQEIEPCIGCMQEPSNVKIFKQCGPNPRNTHPPPRECRDCNCRPMWCVSCMGRWFASRQDQENTSEWLSSKCSCPVCRATFCMLDVAYVETLN